MAAAKLFLRSAQKVLFSFVLSCEITFPFCSLQNNSLSTEILFLFARRKMFCPCLRFKVKRCKWLLIGAQEHASQQDEQVPDSSEQSAFSFTWYNNILECRLSQTRESCYGLSPGSSQSWPSPQTRLHTFAPENYISLIKCENTIYTHHYVLKFIWFSALFNSSTIWL